MDAKYKWPASPWRKRLGARYPSQGFRVRVRFSRTLFFSCFPLPKISFHRFSTLISLISSVFEMMLLAWSAGILSIHWPLGCFYANDNCLVSCTIDYRVSFKSPFSALRFVVLRYYMMTQNLFNLVKHEEFVKMNHG